NTGTGRERRGRRSMSKLGTGPQLSPTQPPQPRAGEEIGEYEEQIQLELDRWLHRRESGAPRIIWMIKDRDRIPGLVTFPDRPRLLPLLIVLRLPQRLLIAAVVSPAGLLPILQPHIIGVIVDRRIHTAPHTAFPLSLLQIALHQRPLRLRPHLLR